MVTQRTMQKLQLFLAGFPPQTKSTFMLLLLEDISFITLNHKMFTIISIKKKVMMIRTHKLLKYERSILLTTLEPTARIFFQALLYELGLFGFMRSLLEIVYGLLSNKRASSFCDHFSKEILLRWQITVNSKKQGKYSREETITRRFC